jgi:predicted Zn finger-like uncharacterized protein
VADRIEVQIPCPKCGGKFPVSLDQIAPGTGVACPKCGSTVNFQGADGARLQHTLDTLGGLGTKVNVKVNVKRK